MSKSPSGLLVALNVMINPKIGKYWIEAMDLIDSSSQAVLS